MTEVEKLVADINAKFGAGKIAPASTLRPHQYRRTGSIALDCALGGGYKKGSIVDLVGVYSAGKTLLWEMAAVTAQREEQLPSLIFDFEQTFEVDRFIALGGNPEMLYVVRAENFDSGLMFLEDATEQLKLMLERKVFGTISLDSTGAMVTKAEYDIKETKGEEQAVVALTARGMTSLLRQVCGTGLLARSGATVFFASQLRDNMHGRGFKGKPPPDKPTGGRALRFMAANQLEVRRGDTFKADVDQGSHVDKDTEVGHETKVIVRKNKNNAKQGRVCTFDLYSEGEVIGIDYIGELSSLAILTGVVTRGGAWISYNDLKWNGKDAFRDALRADKELFASIDIVTRRSLDLQMSVTAQPVEVLQDFAETDPDLLMIEELARREREEEVANAQ